jgi:signal transduction histidine kinase
VVAEALANAAKHAHASEVTVSAHRVDDYLRISVQDNGIGGAELGKGSGLIGLKDRVETLGGTIRVVSPRGGGTSLHAMIPLNVETSRASDLTT